MTTSFFHVDLLVKEAATRGVLNFIKKETLAQVFSCEFCEISKNTFLQNNYGRMLCSYKFAQIHSVHISDLLCIGPKP